MPDAVHGGEQRVAEAACTLGRGRAAMDAPLNLGGEVRLMEERKQSLAQVIEYRIGRQVR